VTAVEEGAVVTGGVRVPTETVVWAAGVQGSTLASSLDVPRDRAGRVLVERDLSIPGDPRTFVVGDLAAFLHQTGVPLPGVAPVAIQQGRYAARAIARDLASKPRTDFRYRDKGGLAVIGRGQAVADLGSLRLSGLVAWLAWAFVHVLFLVGFRNRALVLLEWAWYYVTDQRGARLITGKEDG
jgi:NADH dehydrogenase